MFGPDEEDTDFLSPTGGAKLASLFGMDQSRSAQGNESFQYTAPKQPKKASASAGSKSPKPTGTSAAGPAPAVIFATAVHAYKYVNGQYMKQGKFGAAVLGNHTTKEYRILLYISQQQPVASVRIHPGFTFTVQLNNYAAFYDDQRQSWSVMFESETAAVDFSKQVCIAKCNSFPSLDAVIAQDLTPGDGPAADVGDLLEVAYTGWLYQNQGIGQMFDSNVQKEKLLRLKLGSGKVIKGWEDGMLGMKKGGKRFLVIPPALAYGSQGLSGRIPPNATLLFEVEVRRMKQREAGSDHQSIGSSDSPVSITDCINTETLPQAPTSVPPKPGEPAVRVKSNSISEQLANPDVAKAKLISRMAKMGQPMLPFLAGNTTPQPDSSDSELEDPNTQRMSPHPAAPPPVRPMPQISHPPVPAHMPAPVPQHQPVSGLPISSTALLPMGPIPPGTATGFQPYTGVQYSYPQNPTAATQLQPVGHIYPAPLQQPAPYQGDVTAFLMTEARQHSTEIRMAIGKVIDKIDNLNTKMDSLQKENSAGASHLLPGISSITMESAMIMNNIQRIIQENERLKQEVLDKSSRIEEQNVKIGELINRNQRYVEQSNMLMEQRNDSLKTSSETTQARMLHAMQEKHALHMDLGLYEAKVAEELAAATGELSRLQLEVTAYQKREMDLRTQLISTQQEVEKCRTELSTVQVQLIEVKETSEHTKTRAKTEKDSRRNLELRLVALEDEVSDLKAEKENLEKSLVERKRKSQQDRQRAEGEQDEIRKTFQEEIENLRQLLKKAREQVAAEQLSSSSSRDYDEQKMFELQEQAAQLQPQKEKCAQLQSQITSLTEQLQYARARETERSSEMDQLEEKLSELQQQASLLQPLRKKCAQLQNQIIHLTEQRQKAQSATEDKRTAGKDPTEEVKKIMNGVFQSLRKEFDLEESYSGRVVLGTVMATIKATTLQLLNNPQNEEPAGSSSDEEEEGDEETNAPVNTLLKTEGSHPSECDLHSAGEPYEETSVRKMIETPDTKEYCHDEAPTKKEGGHDETPSTKEGSHDYASATKEGGLVEAPATKEGGHDEAPATKEGGHVEAPATKEGGHVEAPTAKGGCHDQAPATKEGGHDQAPTTKEGSDDEALDTKEENHEVVNESPTPEIHQEAQVESSTLEENGEDFHVMVFQEDLDTPSALVHMISSDMPESSSVTCIEVNGREVIEDLGTSMTKESDPLASQDSHQNLSPEERSLVATSTAPEPTVLEDAKPDTPPLLGSDEDRSSPILPKAEISRHHSTGIHAPREKSLLNKAKPHQEKATDISMDESDEEDLFKMASPKPKHEEEEEEEVSMKGRPPPAPLFGDDDDEDDDLGWLG